ncbi:hypothetical protein B2J88_32650 [Rhodococcus sp. SRB_17]|nr:hypothetical protein [Rhodococcus sp. SRB_17]
MALNVADYEACVRTAVLEFWSERAKALAKNDRTRCSADLQVDSADVRVGSIPTGHVAGLRYHEMG